MRFLFVTSEYPGCRAVPEGGLAHHFRKLAIALAARGNSVRVVVRGDADRDFRDGPVAVHEVRAPGWARFLAGLPGRRGLSRLAPFIASPTWHIATAAAIARGCRRLLREETADLIVTTSLGSPGLLVQVPRGCGVVCRVPASIPTWRKVNGATGTWSDAIADWLELRSARRATVCFTSSQHTARQLESTTPLRPRIIRTLLEDLGSVPLDRSLWREKLVGRRYLVFCGRRERAKGVDMIADILGALLDRHPDLHFVFIGIDGTGIRGKLPSELLVQSAGRHADRVMILGHLPKPRMLPVVGHAIALVHPARTDNYPNAVLEALQLGVPVVGTRDSSVDEMVAHEETGLLCDNGNAGQLLQTLDRLLEMPASELDQMRARIRATVAGWERDDRLAQYLRMFEDAMAIARRSAAGGQGKAAP